MTKTTIRTDENTARIAFENGDLVDAMPAAVTRSTYISEGMQKGLGGIDTWEQFIALARTGLIPEAELAYFVVVEDRYEEGVRDGETRQQAKDANLAEGRDAQQGGDPMEAFGRQAAARDIWSQGRA